jgi:DNA-binding transcriptional ArsR family regulator
MTPNISFVASLIGEPTRASMLTALMGGKALTATELAVEGDISSSTASSHLTKLVEGELLVVRKQGRHKYFQLKDASIAELLEKLLNISAKLNHIKTVTGPTDPRLRKARICYDHLAGEISVSLYDSLVSNKYLIDNGAETLLTEQGQLFFSALGINFELESIKSNKRPLCKSCLDWSERKNHLAGIVGQLILNDLFTQGWATKDLDSRAIQFSQKGLRLFKQKYKIN